MSVIINPRLYSSQTHSNTSGETAPPMWAGCQIFRYYTERIWHPHQLNLVKDPDLQPFSRRAALRTHSSRFSHLERSPIRKLTSRTDQPQQESLKRQFTQTKWQYTHSQLVPNVYRFSFLYSWRQEDVLRNTGNWQPITTIAGKTNTVVVNGHWLLLRVEMFNFGVTRRFKFKPRMELEMKIEALYKLNMPGWNTQQLILSD